jgi:hypothetical protein
MNQVRFQIGVPRAGSAARIAENESSRIDSTSGPFIRPEAGSAARAAEQEKASGSQTAPTIAGFSLRGQNGMVTRNVSVTQGSLNRVWEKESPNETVAQPAPPALQQTPEPLPSESRGSNSQQPLAGPLRLAASRFQTLVQSLFSSSDTTGKS